MKDGKLKNFLRGAWEILVLFAYMKFYLLCLIGTMLSLISAMWILASAGKDITNLAAGFKWVGYMGTTYIAIIMLDKIIKMFSGRRRMNEEMRLLLEAVQLIVKDRTWNNQDFESQSKITDANLSKILNPPIK